MKTEKEIKERLIFSMKKVIESYEEGNFIEMEKWGSYADGLRWVIEKKILDK